VLVAVLGASSIVVSSVGLAAGTAVAQPHPIAGCATHDFEPVILWRYAELGGASSQLGCPVSDTRWTGNGRAVFQDFVNGSIYWQKNVPGAVPRIVLNPIRNRWATLNWENGFLGLPVNDTYPIFGLLGELGLLQGFEHGMIFSSSHGVYEVHGDILAKYLAEGGPGALGFPTSDELSLRDGAQVSHFQAGKIWWSLAEGAIVDVPRALRSWAIRGARLHINDPQEDGLFSDGDEIYFVTFAFRIKPGVPGSAQVRALDVHEEVSDVTDGETISVPSSFGRAVFDNVQAISPQAFSHGDQPVEIIGTVTQVFESDATPFWAINRAADDAEKVIREEFAAAVEGLDIDDRKDLALVKTRMEASKSRIKSRLSTAWWEDVIAFFVSVSDKDDKIGEPVTEFRVAMDLPPEVGGLATFRPAARRVQGDGADYNLSHWIDPA
jgi:hypothetical protein